MKSITAAEALYYRLTNWSWSKGFGPWRNFNKFPPAPDLPPRPWHSDGDAVFTRGALVRVDNSSAIIEHMKASGRMVIGTGSVIPNADGKTEGRRINLATADDPAYTIVTDVDDFKAGTILVNDGHYPKVDDELVGTSIRIPRDAVAQGYPMRGYSDTKIHLYDESMAALVELQHVEDLSNIFFQGRGYRSHGLKILPLDQPSTEVRGACAAKLSLIGGTYRYDDAMAGAVRMTTMGTPQAFALDFLAPARGTDGPSTHPNAVWMGMILRMKPATADRLRALGYPQLTAVVNSFADRGIMVVDTAGNHSLGLEPDARWDQNQLAPLRTASLDWFDIWKMVV